MSQESTHEERNKSLTLDAHIFTSQTIIPTQSLLDDPSNVPHFIHTIPSHSQKSKSHAPLTLVIVKPNLVKIYSHSHLLWKWRVTGEANQTKQNSSPQRGNSYESNGLNDTRKRYSSKVLILKGWIIDETRILLLERHGSIGYTLLKLYCRVWNHSEGQTEVRASLIEMHTNDVCVSAGGFLTYTNIENIYYKGTYDRLDRSETSYEKDKNEKSDKNERWTDRWTEKIAERITGKIIDKGDKPDKDSRNERNFKSLENNGVISLWTWKNPWKVEKILEMRVQDVKVLGLSDESRWFGFATNTDIQVLQWKAMDANENVEAKNKLLISSTNLNESSIDLSIVGNDSPIIDGYLDNFENVFEFGGSTGSQTSKEKYVEMRFSGETGDILPGSTTRNTTVHKSGNTSWIPGIPSRRKKRDTIQPFEIVGEAPNVDHPTILNSTYASSCHVLIHKRIDITEKPVAIHFIRNISSKAEFEKSDTQGMRCIISTSNRGYVYDMKSMRLITQFEYGGECLLSATNSYFLFSLNPAGIEIWSVLGSAKGCMLSFRPFIGLKQVVATNQSVMLLSQFSNEENLSLAVFSESTDTTKPMIMSDMRHIDKLGEKGSLMPLFSASRIKNRNEKTKEQNYNIYILDLLEICDLYEGLLETAESFKLEPLKFLTIMQGAHSLLECKYHELMIQQKQLKDTVDLIRLHIEFNNYTLLLSKSFGFLADAYMGNGQFRKAVSCYARSDRNLRQVCEKYFSYSSEPDLLVFLEYTLFNESKQYECLKNHDEVLGTKILTAYHHYQPQALSKVILNSNLKYYNQDIAIQFILIQNGIKDLNDLNDFSTFRPKDAFALGIMFLRNGQTKKAISAFSIDYITLIDFCVMNSSFIVDSSTSIGKCKIVDNEIEFSTSKPSLGEVLRMKYPWIFLQILLRLEEKLSWKNGLDYIRISPDKLENRLLSELYLIHYFQITKSNYTKGEIAITLYYILLEDLTSIDEFPKEKAFVPEMDLGTLMCWTSHNLFLNRYGWLDEIYPRIFDLPTTIQEILNRLKFSFGSMDVDDEDLPQYFIERILKEEKYRRSVALFTIEGLLSNNRFPFNQISIADLEAKEDFIGKESILAILYLQTRSTSKLIELFNRDNFECYPPSTLVRILKSYCSGMEDWNNAINFLFQNYQHFPRLQSILVKVLNHISTQVTLQELLTLLPPNTNIKFALPFIRKILTDSKLDTTQLENVFQNLQKVSNSY